MRKDEHKRGEPKGIYRVRNWAKYNAGLIARGDVTMWIDESVMNAVPEAASPRRGCGDASCTVSMALSVRGFDEAAAAPSGGLPLRAASKRPGARQRNEGCSCASPGTQRKRVVSSNPPLGQRYSGLSALVVRAFRL